MGDKLEFNKINGDFIVEDYADVYGKISKSVFHNKWKIKIESNVPLDLFTIQQITEFMKGLEDEKS